MARRSILELATLTEHATVAIDGTAYELINPEEISIVDTHRVGKWGARVQELYKDLEARSDEEVSELASLLDRLCRLIWKAPSDVHDRLTDTQRLSVVTAFTGLQRGKRPVPAGANETPAEAPLEGQPATSIGENS